MSLPVAGEGIGKFVGEGEVRLSMKLTGK